jgi:chromate transporter
VSFWQAFVFWLKLGFISFGGPAGQIAIMHEELVVRRRWLSEKRFLHALNYCMVLPGPEAQQLATYIGWLMHKTRGGIAAGVLFVLPSLFMLIGLSWIYMAYGHVTWVAGLFYGIKPAVTAIVLQAAHRIGSRALKNNLLLAIAAASFVAIFALNLPFPIIVLAAAIIGFLGGRMWPEFFSTAGGHAASQTNFGTALINDDTPTPSHADGRPDVMGLANGLLGVSKRMGPHFHTNELVLYQSCTSDLWRCLCRFALCVPRRGRTVRLGHSHPNDGWLGFR